MFKKHPKELLPAILVNTFACFAFYIVISGFIIFLPAKFGITCEDTNIIYSIFFALIFVSSLVGGFVADKTRNYKGTILKGLVLITFGCLFLAIPTPLGFLPYFALFLIALGNGLFTGNMYAVLGQMYDIPEHSQMRDSGFLLYNLFLNIGALFAPIIDVGIRNYWIERNGFVYNFDLPILCNEYIANGKNMDNYEHLEMLAATSEKGTMEMSEFATQYLHVFNTGFYFVFVIAILAMIISLIVFYRNEKKFPIPAKLEFPVPKTNIKLIRQRVYAFLAVFGVLNLFWFAFHQDAFTLTHFARDYVESRNPGFNFSKMNNDFAILATPIVLAIFAILRAKGKETSTLKKMAIGMSIASVAYIVMTISSIGLPEVAVVKEMGGLSENQLVTPAFLIVAFFILAIAKLFVYSLLKSFISQYARPKHQGLMQSLSIFASSIGNILLGLSLVLYKHISVWATWLIFASICLISASIMLSILKWVEKTLTIDENH